ncbi:MAG TPA: sigma-70 family RNA polymerase sigma factor [Candidatus Udaeobacter sp.]|nr:sigma-70 family RNA polymerase sigma factor [Candidatus Udaeobacter sp.]
MKNIVQQPAEVSGIVEHLFRHEGAKMVAILTRIFGIEHLNLAEDVVQEALARALQTWPFYGVPKNPSAWIMRASRNLALDVVRRRKVFQNKQAEISRLMDRDGVTADEAIFSEDEISDDRLRLMFVCCHPAIPAEAQVALALKTLCGFSVGEIGHAFLTTDSAIAKRLTRAKQKIQQARIAFEIPAGGELEQRLDNVLQSLYLLFNEGYKASSGENLVREEFCEEAIRLAELLVAHPVGNQPKTHALLALMLLNAARNPTRLDSEGNLLRLQEQDRTRWDKSMVARGMFHFAQSAAGDHLSEYHLQAGIAACHCAAKDYESTDWPKILSLYDRLIEFDQSPVVALNRAVAIANVHGPNAGLQAVRQVRNLNKLNSYYLLYAVIGEFEMRSGNLQAAAEQFRRSFELAETKSERAFLLKRLQRCVDDQTTVKILS